MIDKKYRFAEVGVGKKTEGFFSNCVRRNFMFITIFDEGFVDFILYNCKFC